MHPHPRNPHLRAVLTFGILGGAALVAAVLFYGLGLLGIGSPALVVIGWIFFGFSVLVILAAWLTGGLRVQRGRAFMESERPVVRWTYSQLEWREMRAAAWQAESQDWKVTWGCLGGLFALIGLLTGMMVGLEEGIWEVVKYGGLGLLVGVGVGALLGGLVAGGNQLGAWLDYRNTDPGRVALAPGEIYTCGDYFKSDGGAAQILEASLKGGSPALLKLRLHFPPRVRLPDEEEWEIQIPRRCLAEVEALLEKIKR
jgi:hypothetical protein